MTAALTSGRPAPLIFRFALPLFIGNLFQQFYGMSDTVIVGRFINVHALASVGGTMGIMFFIIGFIQAMTSGFSLVIARHVGARDADNARRAFCAGLFLCAGLSLALTIAGVLFSRDILLLLRTPPALLDDAHRFIRIVYAGSAATTLFNMLSNAILALGDSRPPLLFLSAACLCNIILELLFILGFGMGVEGAACATVLAQVFSSLLCVAYIVRKVPLLHPRREHWRIRANTLSESARIGLPMGFQASIIAIGAIIMQWALNGLGETAVAAFSIARTIDLIAILPMASFGLAMGTYVGQNYGAGDIARIRLGVRHCAAMSLSFSVGIALANILLGPWCIRLFTGAGHEEILRPAYMFLMVNGSMYWVLSLLFIFRFSLQGLGKSLAPTLAGIMELLMRTLAAVVLTRSFGLFGASLANPLAWIGACIPLGIAYFRTVKKLEEEKTDMKNPLTFSQI
ncbi:MAG: MATE family efflux transporter [Desulfovibrio sp.]|jgi:putative MATE family efflux protein|nr:MATE family efflux transporter [Desulfovibrio sp.]